MGAIDARTSRVNVSTPQSEVLSAADTFTQQVAFRCPTTRIKLEIRGYFSERRRFCARVVRQNSVFVRERARLVLAQPSSADQKDLRPVRVLLHSRADSVLR